MRTGSTRRGPSPTVARCASAGTRASARTADSTPFSSSRRATADRSGASPIPSERRNSARSAEANRWKSMPFGISRIRSRGTRSCSAMLSATAGETARRSSNAQPRVRARTRLSTSRGNALPRFARTRRSWQMMRAPLRRAASTSGENARTKLKWTREGRASRTHDHSSRAAPGARKSRARSSAPALRSASDERGLAGSTRLPLGRRCVSGIRSRGSAGSPMADPTTTRLPDPGLVPPAVMGVLRTLRGAKKQAWLAGGAVRDLLRIAGGEQLTPPQDFDVATDARPEEVQRLFPRTAPTGIAHGTVTVLADQQHKVEVTTFRGEGPYLDGRRPSSVVFLGDIEGDLARRDFTVNAMAWDPVAGELRDPFGGARDLRQGLLRAVGEPLDRFREDGLRPLRAVRFASTLRLALDLRTERAIPQALEVFARVAG